MENNIRLDKEVKKILAPLVAEKIKKENVEKILISWALAMRYPWHFLTNFVYTLDQHTKKGENPIKLFPKIPYLQWLTQVWAEKRLLLISKSRQMLLSWLAISLYTWDSLAHAARYTFFQSRKLENAGFGSPMSLLARSLFVYDHLPEIVKKKNPIIAQKKPPVLRFYNTNSVIHAISQDSEEPRQFTSTGFLADEMGFQENSERALIAAMPTLDITGRYTGISSANGKNFWWRLLNDRTEFSTWMTK